MHWHQADGSLRGFPFHIRPAQIFQNGAARRAIKRAGLIFFGKDVFRFAATNRDFLATVGGGKNPFWRTIKSCRGCSHQINSMIELLPCQLQVRQNETSTNRSAAIFSNYGWLVIFCQLIPCVPAKIANAFSFWISTARTTLESSARPNSSWLSGRMLVFLCA